jgi:hypothetical protein
MFSFSLATAIWYSVKGLFARPAGSIKGKIRLELNEKYTTKLRTTFPEMEPAGQGWVENFQMP